MTTAPNSTGLKNQWGVGNPTGGPSKNTTDGGSPADTGSDRQRQEFQAAFEGVQSEINGHLQYTAANAEASRHQPLAGRRDAMVPKYQGMLGQIDRNDPSKAQGAIDSLLGEARELAGEASSFRQEVEKAKTEWEGKQPQYDEAVAHVEELEAWEDPQASALRGETDAIRTHANERRWSEASSACDQVQGRLAPVYEEYLRQKDAKAQYEPALQALQPRLDAVATGDRPKLQAERDAVGTSQNDMEASAQSKDYVKAQQVLGDVTGRVEAYEQALQSLDEQKQAFQAAWDEVQAKLSQVEQSTFKKLEAQQQEITAGRAPVEAAAAQEDYEQATTLASELSAKCDQYATAVTELEQQRQAYETAWNALQPRYEQTAQSEFQKLAPMQQEMTAIKGRIDAAVQAEDYASAVTQVNDLATKVDTFLADADKARQERQAYDDAWAVVGPKFTEAQQSTAPKLATQRDELSAQRQAIDAAVQAEDYAQAKSLTDDLGARTDSYLEEVRKLEELRAQYDSALSALQPELDAVGASPSASLQPLRDEIGRIKGEMESAAASEDFESALRHVEDLRGKAAAYRQELDKERQQYDQQRERVEPGMQELNTCTFAQLEAKKAAVLSAYQAMVQKGDAEDYAAAAAAGREVEVAVSDFLAEAKTLRESIKSNLATHLPQVEADMKEIAEDRAPQKGQIDALHASVKAAAGGQDDAALEKAATDLEELSRLVNEVKNDPCNKARRTNEYKTAMHDWNIAKMESRAAMTAVDEAKKMGPAKAIEIPPDPRKPAQAQWDLKKAEDAYQVALAKEMKAYDAVKAVLKGHGCTEAPK